MNRLALPAPAPVLLLENTWHKWERVIRECKALALSLNVPVYMTHERDLSAREHILGVGIGGEPPRRFVSVSDHAVVFASGRFELRNKLRSCR